jgi:hypothetical protein
MGLFAAQSRVGPLLFFMSPETIIQTYIKSTDYKEKTLLAHKLMGAIVRDPVCDKWNFKLHDYDEEMWKDIPGFEGQYQLSSYGRVKRFKKHLKDGELIQKSKTCFYRSVSGRSYPHTRLGSKANYTPIIIHIEVAKLFVPNPNNYPIVNHLDGDKNNAYYKNLEWATDLINMRHARDTGLNRERGERSENAKLTDEQVLFIFNSKLLYRELAKMFDVTGTTICCLKRGVTWSHITGKVFEPQRIKKELAAEIYKDEGLTNRELSVKYKVPQSTVFNIKRGFTFAEVTGAKFKPRVSNKIKGNTYYLGVDKIREIFKATGTYAAIGERFETSPSTVWAIKRRKKWAEVTENI